METGKRGMSNGLFLVEHLTQHDLALLHIVEGPILGRAALAKVEQVYLARKEVSGDFLVPGAEVDFLYGGRVWRPWGGGDLWLKTGERALVFLSENRIFGLHQEAAIGGQLVLQNIDNELYAVHEFAELWRNGNVPSLIRVNTRPHPRCSFTSAIRFDVIKADLQASLEQIKQGNVIKRDSDVEVMSDRYVVYHYDNVPLEIRPIIYHRAQADESVADRHAACVEHFKKLDGPFGLKGAGPLLGPLFTNGGYWERSRHNDDDIVMGGWYAFRGIDAFADKTINDDHLNYQFKVLDPRIDYKKLIHEDFKQAILAFGGYRAVWSFDRYGFAYQRGYFKKNDAVYDENYCPEDTYDIPSPLNSNKQYIKLRVISEKRCLDVDGRNFIYTLYPAQFWDAELCQHALGYGPDEVVARLRGKVPQVERLRNGVYLVLNDDPNLSFDEFIKMNESYKNILDLERRIGRFTWPVD